MATGPATHDENGIENPLARLTDEQLEAIGKELDQLHDEVQADLSDRDARTSGDHRAAAAPRPAGARGAVREPLRPAWWRAWRCRGQDPGEHGDRPQRHARPMGLDERPGDQLPELGLGHRLHRRGLEALPQLHPPHLHQHPGQGPRPRLRDHADRPAAAVVPGVPAPARHNVCSCSCSSGAWRYTIWISRPSAPGRSKWPRFARS